MLYVCGRESQPCVFTLTAVTELMFYLILFIGLFLSIAGFKDEFRPALSVGCLPRWNGSSVCYHFHLSDMNARSIQSAAFNHCKVSRFIRPIETEASSSGEGDIFSSLRLPGCVGLLLPPEPEAVSVRGFSGNRNRRCVTTTSSKERRAFCWIVLRFKE